MSAAKKLFTICAGLMAASAVVPASHASNNRLYPVYGQDTAHRIVEGSTVLAPFPFIRFCVSNPGLCEPSRVKTVRWSERTRQAVLRVNRHVNGSIRPRHDKGDVWSVNVRSGDCEDFALTKRQTLINQGLPASALRLAVATTYGGEGHAVLVIKTDAGDFVLDNRHSRIMSWDQTDLNWIKIASDEDPMVWRQMH